MSSVRATWEMYLSRALLALIRDENKIVLAGRHTSGKPKINVFTAAGYPIVTLTVRLGSSG